MEVKRNTFFQYPYCLHMVSMYTTKAARICAANKSLPQRYKHIYMYSLTSKRSKNKENDYRPWD